MRTIVRPEIIAFILCDRADRGASGLTLMNLRTYLAVQKLPSPPLQVVAYIEMRLPKGAVEVALEIGAPSGAYVMPPQTMLSETAFGGGVKIGIPRMRLEFAEHGWHTARLRVGDVFTERELCVLTPETKHLYEHPSDPS